MKILHLAITTFAILFTANALIQETDAGLVIAADNVTITNGSTAFLNVNIFWTPDLIPDTSIEIAGIGVDFTIFPTNSTTSTVSFATYDYGPSSPGSFYNGDYQLSATNYIFSESSRIISSNGAERVGTVEGLNNTRFVGNDQRLDFFGTYDNSKSSLVDASGKLAFRFEISATGLLSGEDKFRLNLTDSFGLVVFGGVAGDAAFPLDYKYEGGEITVIAASGGPTAVPEPSSILIFATGTAALFLRRRKSNSSDKIGTSIQD